MRTTQTLNPLDFRFKTWAGKAATTFYSLTNMEVLKDFQTLKNRAFFRTAGLLKVPAIVQLL